MKLSKNALTVLEKRYLAKDSNGNPIETAEELFRRVAGVIASADRDRLDESKIKALEEEFYDMMVNLEFFPNSPTLMNAGRPLGQLSACFVLPVEDSMEEIFNAIKNAALIHKSGGGTGFSFSRLRPKGSSVKSTGGIASGPVSFMKVFNSATEAVKQGGTRRGANMGILRVDHPDILEFITCKQDNTDITNFNISVGITEKFMEAVENDLEYALIEPHTGNVTSKLKAKAVFDLIIENSWNNGEPGIIFLDRLNKDNVTPALGEIESTNPCGEQPLLPFEACNLGSLNLYAMLEKKDGRYYINFEKLGKTVDSAVHFLDNVIDVNNYPLEEIDRMTRGTRKIGLGLMGWADALYRLGIPYNSVEAIALAEKVMKFVQETARNSSIKLAEEKGVFPFFDKSIYAENGPKVRNATTTTIAPTGTISIIAGTSSGIEPVFALSFIRNVMDNNELIEVNPVFKEIAVERGFYSDDLMKKIAKEGTLQHIEGIPDDVKRVFVTAHDITPEWHVKMQSAFQKYTDNAVSKTVNLRNKATKDDVRKVFISAYKTGCKGVTIYRDGSRDLQVLNIGKVKGKDQKGKTEHEPLEPRPRPEITTGFTEKVKIGCGNLYITVNYDESGICEVFTNTGRAGGCPSQSEATSRLVSIALRSGIDSKVLVEQLKGIRCPSTIRQNGLKVLSCPDAIGRLIEKVDKLQNGERAEISSTNTDSEVDCKSFGPTANRPGEAETALKEGDGCPECGSKLEHEGGCVVCRNCGYGKCG